LQTVKVLLWGVFEEYGECLFLGGSVQSEEKGEGWIDIVQKKRMATRKKKKIKPRRMKTELRKRKHRENRRGSKVDAGAEGGDEPNNGQLLEFNI